MDSERMCSQLTGVLRVKEPIQFLGMLCSVTILASTVAGCGKRPENQAVNQNPAKSDSGAIQVTKGDSANDSFLVTKEEHSGLFSIRVDYGGKNISGQFYGYMNKRGEEVIPAIYSEAYPFSSGVALVKTFVGEDEYRVINSQGEALFSLGRRDSGLARYEFHDGCLLMRETVHEESYFTYIDKQGKHLTSIQFSEAEDFREGLARVVPLANNPNREVYFLNIKGELLLGPYENGSVGEAFSEGLVPIKRNEKWGYMDKSGRIVIAPKYPAYHDFSDGFAVVAEQEQGSRMWDVFYVDRTGRHVLKGDWSAAYRFSEGLARTERANGEWCYINKTGKAVITGKYAKCWDFRCGLARVIVSRLAGFIDRSGKYVVEPQFVDAEDFDGGLAWVLNKTGHRQYINTEGQVVWEQPSVRAKFPIPLPGWDY